MLHKIGLDYLFYFATVFCNCLLKRPSGIIFFAIFNHMMQNIIIIIYTDVLCKFAMVYSHHFRCPCTEHVNFILSELLHHQDSLKLLILLLLITSCGNQLILLWQQLFRSVYIRQIIVQLEAVFYIGALTLKKIHYYCMFILQAI